jgi:uncharacterized protein YndB with AHSA1/START domain
VADGSSTVGTLRMNASSGTMATLQLPTLAHPRSYGNLEVAQSDRSRPMRSEIHEETIEGPPADVWGFMVDPAALSAWFGADAWLVPAVGEAVRFRFADGTERRGTVEEVEPFRVLRWRWRRHRGTGFGSQIGEMSTVAIELAAVPGGTRVRIVETPAVRAVSRSA